MFLGVLESRCQGTIFAFGFMKKYVFSKKLQRKTFCTFFFITRFEKNMFREKKRKYFQQQKHMEKLGAQALAPWAYWCLRHSHRGTYPTGTAPVGAVLVCRTLLSYIMWELRVLNTFFEFNCCNELDFGMYSCVEIFYWSVNASAMFGVKIRN